jgi:DNA repair exonuclease SbcCD ATPase subunit
MKFEPLYLEIENFMNHSFSKIDFNDFNSCLIVGKDNDNSRKSNGVGKSTIYHAIVFVLFNEVPTKTIDKIVREGQSKCRVSFEFLVDDQKYKITRKRSNASNKMEVLLDKWNGSWVQEDNRTKSDTEKDIKSLLKINYESFKNSVLFSQGGFSDLSEGTNAQKIKVLKEPLDLSIYSKYEKNAKKKLSSIEMEYNTNNELIKSLGDPLKDIEYCNVSLKELSDKLKIYNENFILLKEKINLKREKINELNKLLNSDDAKNSEQIIQISNNINSLLKDSNDLNDKISKFNIKIKDLKEKENTFNLNLKNEKDNLKKLESEKFPTENELNEKIKELSESEVRGHKYIASLESKIEHYSKPLPKGSSCEHCFNELDDNYREKISKTHQEKLADVKIELQKSKIKLENLIEKKEFYLNKIKELAKNQFAIKTSKSSIANIELNIKNNNDLIIDIEKSIKESNDNNLIILKKVDDLKEKESFLKEKISSFDSKSINDDIILLNKEIEKSTQEESSLFKEINLTNSLIGQNQSKLDMRSKDLEKLNEILNKNESVRRNLNIYNKVVKAFSSSGIPTLIIHTILDDLQFEANNILQEIRPELEIQFLIQKDDKEILDIVYKLNGKERDYKQLSGGQRTYISFALKLGLSVIIQKRMGINYKFLALDEVDQALDEDGKDSYVEIIKKFQDKYKILVITHDARLQSKFPYILSVDNDKDNGATINVIKD